MNRPPPRGRGALMAALKLQKEKEAEKPVGIEPEPPKPTQARGRSASLLKLLAAKPGPSVETTTDVNKPTSSGSTSSVPVSSDEPTKTVSADEPTKADVPVSPSKSSVEEITRSTSQMSFVEKEPVYFQGESGKPLRLSVNYIKLELAQDRGVYEYEIKFNPELDAKNKRFRAANQVIKQLGMAKVFDGGNTLYLPQQITSTSQTFTVDDEEKTISVKLIYKKKKNMADYDCLHLYNVLFKRIMNKLKYTAIGKNYFDTNSKHLVPQHKLEIYPGFAIAVDQQEDGLMLCLDPQHRVLRTQNANELLRELRSQHRDIQTYQKVATEYVIGCCVFTKYNNKNYIVDDIIWDQSPQNTFPTRDGNHISYIEYYKQQYNITIQDYDQPLLINKKEVPVQGSEQKVERVVCLIPEITHLTGLTDNMRSDFKVMKDVAQFTRVTPNQRVAALRKYLQNINNNEEAKQILADWGLKIANDTLNLGGRKLDNEIIYFGQGQQFQTNNNADWTRPSGENQVTGPVDMYNWIVFHTDRDRKYAYDFGELMCKLGNVMGCHISKPKMVKLPGDTNENYIQACQQYIDKNVQIVVFICPTMRSDRYGHIKKMCCSQIPVPSQVINSRTLSNPGKVRSIVQKIALQMTCKLGGTLWTVRFPFKGWMICGIDVYHGKKSSSVCGFVSSLNESVSRWFSTATFQAGELGDFMKTAFIKALEATRNANGYYPKKVVIVRDGVGDGQLTHCQRYEVKQLESCLKELELDIKICFVVVQKRISTRIFSQGHDGADNPPCGTILDHSITRRQLPDFFLVPQSVRQGTVNPTHYIVLHDTCGLKPDHIQRLCYKLCHLYYNWPGTIRVPAPCMYAHKLASLVGQHLKKLPSAALADKLFYL
ncbi:piwi-like protein Ago3 [Diabrotica virgifera virgifera]|uniref:Argonaute 3 n=1 Tax=Diabrotica virgifera virgifera TaxID=50390 RepID=A0A2I6PIY3_DIAVI|nr:piwi-like protein Ago3 [Diabrotica virgifera virgifera]AUM60043.1 argonaute 3 [Diabrotica virgifera virgifera]